jgi:flagellar hook assembly protein FlgD
VFDVMGRKVCELLSEDATSGRKSIVWDGRDGSGRSVSSGAYLVRLEAGERVMFRQVVRAR